MKHLKSWPVLDGAIFISFDAAMASFTLCYFGYRWIDGWTQRFLAHNAASRMPPTATADAERMYIQLEPYNEIQ